MKYNFIFLVFFPFVISGQVIYNTLDSINLKTYNEDDYNLRYIKFSGVTFLKCNLNEVYDTSSACKSQKIFSFDYPSLDSVYLKEEYEYYIQGKIDFVKKIFSNGEIENTYQQSNRGDYKHLTRKWFSNGQIKSEWMVFRDNNHYRRVGPETDWYENGQKKYYSFNDIDGKQLKSSSWNTSGNLISDLNFKNNKKHGVCRWWNDENLLTHEHNYINGELNGICIWRDSTGVWKGYYENGNFIKSVK